MGINIAEWDYPCATMRLTDDSQCLKTEKNRYIGKKTTFSGKIAWKYVKSVYTSILKQEKLFGVTLSDMFIQSFYKRMPKIESSKIDADSAALLRDVPAIDIIDK